MNTIVTTTNMQIKAIADDGLLINEVATSNSASWDNAATTNQTEAIVLHATSTAETANWYTASSKKYNSAAKATSGTVSPDLVGGYTLLNSLSQEPVAAAAGSNAGHVIYYADGNGNGAYDNGEGYYVKYTYYLKSSAEAITTGIAKDAQNLNIKSVTATSATTNSEDLDLALRVVVVVGGKAYFIAPVYSGSDNVLSYVNASSTATTAYVPANIPLSTGTFTIPANTSDGMAVDIYLYFEGEDTNLKTENLAATLDTMVVSVEFELVTNAAAVTDRGVSTTVTP